MAKSFVFNPFTGNFDEIDQVTTAPAGSTPNADGASASNNVLTLQPADSTHPGILTSGAQTIGGIKTFFSGVDLNSNKITSVADPAAAQDAATKNYVDTVASGLNPLQAVYAGSTVNIVGTYNNGVAGVGATFTVTATGAFTIDGTTPPASSRILLKDQSNGFENGVYDLTNAGGIGISPVLTRSLDFNSPSNINAGDLIPVINGTVNAVTSWLQTATVANVGVDSLVFVEWSYNPANFLLKANNLSDVASPSTSFNNISPVTSVGDLIVGNGVNSNTRLGIGSHYQALQSNGTTAVYDAIHLDQAAAITGLLPQSNLASMQVNKYFYVDGQRTDSYTADGSFQRPFKTVNSSLAQIVANADNATHAYTIFVQPASYSETITLNNALFYNVTIAATIADSITVQNVTFSGLLSNATNTNLATLNVIGLTFSGAVNLTGDVNGTNFGSSQILFNGCFFNNSGSTITLNNVNNVSFYSTQIQGGAGVSTFTNVAFAYIEGPEGVISGYTLNLVDNPGGNVPSQYSGNYLLFSTTKFGGTMTIDAGSELDCIQSYFSSVNTVTNNGTIHSFASSWNGTLNLNAGSSSRFRGDTFFNKPILTGGPTVTYQGYNGYAPTTSANWNTVPKFIQDALDTLATSGVVKSQTQNLVLASPNGSSGVPSFRALVSADLPPIPPPTVSLTQNHILVGTASNVGGDVAMSGDATIVTSGALTLATVNANVGSFGSSTSIPSFTVNAKGLVTAASGNVVIAPAGTLSGTTLNSTVVSSSLTSVGTITSGTWNGTTIDVAHGGTGQTSLTAHDVLVGNGTSGITQISPSTSGFVLTSNGTGSDPSFQAIALSSLPLTQNHIIVGNASNVGADVAMSGDATIVASGALTLATVNSNVGSFGSSTSIPSFTVNAKGLITAASGNVVIAPAGTLSGTTLNATVVSSSLTSVGTITSGTWNGTTIDVAHGGTGATTLTANNVILGNGTSAVNFVAPSTTGNVLTSNGTTWVSSPQTNATSAASIAVAKPQSTYTADTAIVWPTVSLNVGSNYNNSTGAFTAPATGYYLVTAGITCSNTSGSLYAAVAGSRQTPPLGNLNATGTATGATVVSANSGQVIDVRLSVSTTMQTPDNTQGVTFVRLG